jgi:type IV secretion system protein TrbI
VSMDRETYLRAGNDNEPGRSASMRLGAERPRVTRLSRKVLAGAAAVGSAAIFGATFWALQNNRSQTSAPSELYTTDHHNVADGLAGLPRDYAGVPRQAPPLGPALPGDLGRPILNAQNAPSARIPANDSEQQRLDEETEAARLSRLFASTSIREVASSIAQAASVGATTIVPNQASLPVQPGANDTFTQNGQDRKLAFVNASVDTRTTSPDRVAAPASSYVVQAGNIIPAALITGIRSDLPGQISTLLGVGSELGSTTGTGGNSDVITALRRGSSDSLNQTGQKVVQRNLDIQPTLTVRPGFPVRVIVNRDLVLEPYRG